METQNAAKKEKQLLTFFLLYALAAAVLARLAVIFWNEINWDEFLFLSQVYLFRTPGSLPPMQTIHVRAFGWLAAIPGGEANQIIAARLIMGLLQMLTAACLYGMARRFFSVQAALFAALSYMSFTFVLWQGTSFRADPIAAALLVSSLYLITAHPEKLKAAALAGALIGLAAMVTIKSVFFVPAAGLILLTRFVQACRAKSGGKQAFLYAATVGAVAAAVLLLLYLWHASGLQKTGDAGGQIARGYAKTIGETALFPALRYFTASLLPDVGFWLFAALGLLSAFLKGTGERKAVLLACATPLLTLIFYRNAFPYYYVFMLPPVAVLCAAGWDAMAEKKRPATKTILFAAILIALSNIVVHGLIRPRAHSMDAQRTILAEIHKMFPAPVPYIDRCAMVSSFPKAGFFMSTWGFENYRKRGEPVLAQTIAEKQPVFMLANIAQLDVANTIHDEQIPESYDLLPEDSAALRDHYIPWWGPVYLAGKKVTLTKANEPQRIEILIGGPYTIDASTPITVDGKPYRPGETITLSPGPHDITASKALATITLTWGETRPRPQTPPPQKPVFSGF